MRCVHICLRLGTFKHHRHVCACACSDSPHVSCHLRDGDKLLELDYSFMFVCLCLCAIPCAGKNNSPWMFGVSGVPGSDRRWRPVSDDCLMIWDTVRGLGCGESPKNTGFSCACASLERDRQRFNENICIYLFKSHETCQVHVRNMFHHKKNMN